MLPFEFCVFSQYADQWTMNHGMTWSFSMPDHHLLVLYSSYTIHIFLAELIQSQRRLNQPTPSLPFIIIAIAIVSSFIVAYPFCTYVLGPHAPSHITQSQMLRWLFLWLDLRPVFSCWHSSMSFWWYSDWSSTDCLYSCTCLLAPPLNLTDLFRSSFLTSFFIIRKQTFCVWLCVCLVALCVFVCTATHTLRSIRSGSFGEWGGDHHVSRN